MFNSKYGNVLTVLLIIIIIAIIGLLGYVGFNFYKKYYTDKDAQTFIEQYEKDINTTDNSVNNSTDISSGTVTNPIDNLTQSNSISNGATGNKTYTYKGFPVVGVIEIPKTGIKYPILKEVTPKAIETAVAMLYGPGPNEIGNTVIIGHNYRNGAFFGKNKQLANGDIIYITDNNGTKVKYTIYNIHITTPEDSEYMMRNTNGAREISLSTCTDDSKQRLVIWAKE